jgi:hypothetical protein
MKLLAKLLGWVYGSLEKVLQSETINKDYFRSKDQTEPNFSLTSEDQVHRQSW